MRTLFSTLALVVTTGLAASQSVNLTGRGMRVSVPSGAVGTVCVSTTSCVIPALNAAGATSTFVIRGRKNGLFVVFLDTAFLPCPNPLPSLGQLLLPAPITLQSGIMNLNSLNTGCVGAAQFAFPPGPMGATFYVQAVVETPGQQAGWTDRIRLNY